MKFFKSIIIILLALLVLSCPDPYKTEAEYIEFDYVSLYLEVNETFQLAYTIYPTNAQNSKVTWESSNTSIVTVNSSGLITALNTGEAYITASTGNVSAICYVYVQTNNTITISLDHSSLDLFKYQYGKLNATITPYLSNAYIYWSSSNESVASVSDGLIIAKETGITTISAYYQGKTASCLVNVREPNRTFNAYNIKNNYYYKLGASKRAEGNYSIVYTDNNLKQNISELTAQSICNEFDNKIYNKIKTNFADESDVDNNGKIILLLLDIEDGFDPNKNPGYIAGYFDPTDLFDKTTEPYSNETDMLYLDVNPSEVGSEDFYSTIAHEFQHLVNFNSTYIQRNFLQDVWINEGLSSGAEYLYLNKQLQSRIDYFNNDPMGTIKYGNNFFVWNGFWENSIGDILADYATVYLFFQWLQIHANNGTSIYKDILSENYGDYHAICNAAYLKIASQFGSWETLLKTWLLAPLLNEATGYMGYKKQINISPWLFNSNNNVLWTFSPGEGIFTKTSTGSHTPDPSGSHIRYIGVNMSTFELDENGPTYNGDIILTYNANNDNNASDEDGYLSNNQSKQLSYENLFNIQSNSSAMPKKYPVSILLSPGKGMVSESHTPNIVHNKTLESLLYDKKRQ